MRSSTVLASPVVSRSVNSLPRIFQTNHLQRPCKHEQHCTICEDIDLCPIKSAAGNHKTKSPLPQLPSATLCLNLHQILKHSSVGSAFFARPKVTTEAWISSFYKWSLLGYICKSWNTSLLLVKLALCISAVKKKERALSICETGQLSSVSVLKQHCGSFVLFCTYFLYCSLRGFG